MPNMDDRRRRALWRATHRGTKEMDWLLGRYADAHIAGMSEAELVDLEAMIAVPDPDLQSWIMEGTPADTAHTGLVARIRAFNGLEPIVAGAVS